MADKKQENKVVLEREYIVPLRKGWLKVPMYKRANKAVKTLKEFIARHMKVYDRDLRKIKVDIRLNNEIRFRGMKKTLNKIKVRAEKLEDGTVKVSLFELPVHLKFAKLREEKIKAKQESKKVKKVSKIEENPIEVKEESEEAKEKEEASREEGLKKSKEQAKEQKHVSKEKKVMVKRKALSR